MRADKRRIQTAVLGGAGSEEPLMLPMEAIELDAFRHAHESDTFWCGTLLGGCGGQLTTKLYTDRACHFAHHPDPDGLPHVCGRAARGVNSADHLYVKSAAAAWLADRGEQATFAYTRPEGGPLGSVVDVRWRHGALRVHLDQTAAPVWDDAVEPVLGTMVPVDRDTLVRRWYVHRIRLDSEGTARRVRIGTEAFARPTEWFALDECEMTERGLSTPAVERIIRSRSTPPPARQAPGKDRKAPDVRIRAQVLFRRIEEARAVGSVVVVVRVSHTLAALDGVDHETQTQIDTVLKDAKVWLQEQAVARQEMFTRLSEAVAEGNVQETRGLLTRVNAIAAHDRTDTETQTAREAASFLAGMLRQQEETARKLHAAAEAKEEARRRVARQKTEALQQVRKTLRTLRRHGRTMPGTEQRRRVAMLTDLAAKAGDQLSRSEAHQIEAWKARVQRERETAAPEEHAHPGDRASQSVQPAQPRPMGRKVPLHEKVARRFWLRRHCPVCDAQAGQACTDPGEPGGEAVRREHGHDERIEPIVKEREAATRANKAREPEDRRTQRGSASMVPYYRLMKISCPVCQAKPDAECALPAGSHQARVDILTRYRNRSSGRRR
ncbi:hypothetical protein [Streptomyces sp. 35G-GA-8]|uniref:hypothetical protein n=1 Tax=Streptomyces sp. 35G-GA-8 TaxID=2939434 RepID=UPI00201F1DC5|nr:hypothetical protein [Streptomyces sp. 35G-GA-8]MCL7382527.1 hypothetical protein [Streptomyces sp. 35G-GA-8]